LLAFCTALKNREPFTLFSGLLHPVVKLHALDLLLQLFIRKYGCGEQILHYTRRHASKLVFSLYRRSLFMKFMAGKTLSSETLLLTIVNAILVTMIHPEHFLGMISN
jgi:hypothetical protein